MQRLSQESISEILLTVKAMTTGSQPACFRLALPLGAADLQSMETHQPQKTPARGRGRWVLLIREMAPKEWLEVRSFDVGGHWVGRVRGAEAC